MTQIHKFTSESFMQGALEIITECPICKTIAVQRLGWVQSHCTHCNCYYNHSLTIPDIVLKRRKCMNLSRKEMGEKTGYSPNSIKKYEFVECTHAYLKATEKVFREFLENKRK